MPNKNQSNQNTQSNPNTNNPHESLYQNLIQMLCPAGSGVYTVGASTGKSKQNIIQQTLYNATTSEDVILTWQQHLKTLSSNKKPLLLGVCSDTGGGIQRGANWGPLYLRELLYSKLEDNNKKHSLFDLGDVRVIPQLLHDKYLNEATINDCRKALYDTTQTQLPVSPLSITETVITQLFQQFPDTKLLTLGGDHSISYPVVKAFLTAKQASKNNIGIIHFDAHTDLLRKRLGIDINFGSWARHIIPFLAAPDHLVQIGIRATAKPKSHWENTVGVKQIWAEEISDDNLNKVIDEIIDHLASRSINELYISFDIDCIDARFVTATGTSEPNGLMPQQTQAIIAALSSQFDITGADLVEVAPMVINNNSDLPQPETTLTVADRILRQLAGALQGGGVILTEGCHLHLRPLSWHQAVILSKAKDLQNAARS